MRVVRVHDFDLNLPMLIDEVPKPEPKEGEILIKSQAVGLNPVDIAIRAANHPYAKLVKPPYIPGAEASGEIVELGNGVSDFSVGERGRMKEAQDPQNHLGTVIRLQENGKVPQDNPFLKNRKGRAEIFSYGHRNPQGMALHPKTGKIWVHEHGPQGGDEINILKAGANYGWPKTTFGEQYGGGKIGIGPKSPGIEEPLLHWTPSIAPSGMDFYQGDIFPNWNGDLLVGSLKFRMLVRVDLEGSLVQGQEVVFQDRIGRVRDVRVSPEGKVYLLNDEYRGGIFRLDPL